MAPDQLQLDFSVADTAYEKPSLLSATVHDLDAARRVRHRADLGSVYRGIYESIKHIRLDRAIRNAAETPATKR